MKKTICTVIKVLAVLAAIAGAAACVYYFLKKAGLASRCCCDGDACLDDFGIDDATGEPATGETIEATANMDAPKSDDEMSTE